MNSASLSQLSKTTQVRLRTLKKLVAEYNLQTILATTLPENADSIKLLKKIGLTFEKGLKIENNNLHI